MRTSWHIRRLSFAAQVLVVLAACLPLCAQPQADTGTIILDTSGFWRVHYTFMAPVVMKDGKAEELEPCSWWVRNSSPMPPEDWSKSDFDDAGWARFPGVFHVSPHYGIKAYKSPFMSLACMRGRFRVTDPAKVGKLTLSASYHGGIVIYLNGKEVARGHLPAGGGLEQLAEPYAYEKYDPKHPETKCRTLPEVTIPASALRKGINVLAVEAHRAAYDERDVARGKRRHPSLAWGSCGVVRVRLKTTGGRGIVPNVGVPKGLQVWTSNPMQVDCDLDHGAPNETLRPIALVGTRNGAFSGKVVIGSDNPIKGLQAVMSDLQRVGGDGRIANSAVQVRYAVADWRQRGMEHRYLEFPRAFAALDETCPQEIPVTEKHARPWSFKPMDPQGVKLTLGAVKPAWITVNVPADATPGDYRGTLTIRAAGEEPVNVPVRLKVCGWKLPDPVDYATWVDIIQSPESVAMQYDVPVWSDAHFKYLEKSLELLGSVGNKATYVHLICHTNAGNSQSMVRWIRQDDGTWKYDITPMEKYLDLLAKHGIRPSVVCLYVWDTYLEGGRGGPEQYASQATKEGRAALADKGPLVSVLDEATGAIQTVALPMYSEPEKSMAAWKALMARITAALEKRGLKDKMMLGISTDNKPTKEVIDFFRAVLPGVPWVSQGHAMPAELHGIPVKYLSGVWAGGRFPPDPAEGHTHGWMRTFTGLRSKEFSTAGGAVLVHHPRNEWWNFPISSYRMLGEMNIAGSQRGFARIGADFWPVLKDKRGRLARLPGRFPETVWRNLDIRSCVFSPGKEGALSTQRFEMLREGIQECEARIFIEKALIDGKIDGELAARCRSVLDNRIAPMRLGVSLLAISPDADNTWWNWPGLLGYEYFVGSGWQARSAALYDAAAEVAAAVK